MNSHELVILLINTAIILAAYFSVYPKFAKADAGKIAKFDLVFSGLALLIAGILYFASDIRFTFIFFELNWFWFTLLLYGLLEIPILLWYLKKYDVKFFEE